MDPLLDRREGIRAINRDLIYAVLLVEGYHDEALTVGREMRYSIRNAEDVTRVTADHNAIEAFVTVL